MISKEQQYLLSQLLQTSIPSPTNNTSFKHKSAIVKKLKQIKDSNIITEIQKENLSKLLPEVVSALLANTSMEHIYHLIKIIIEFTIRYSTFKLLFEKELKESIIKKTNIQPCSNLVLHHLILYVELYHIGFCSNLSKDLFMHENKLKFMQCIINYDKEKKFNKIQALLKELYEQMEENKYISSYLEIPIKTVEYKYIKIIEEEPNEFDFYISDYKRPEYIKKECNNINEIINDVLKGMRNKDKKKYADEKSKLFLQYDIKLKHILNFMDERTCTLNEISVLARIINNTMDSSIVNPAKLPVVLASELCKFGLIDIEYILELNEQFLKKRNFYMLRDSMRSIGRFLLIQKESNERMLKLIEKIECENEIERVIINSIISSLFIKKSDCKKNYERFLFDLFENEKLTSVLFKKAKNFLIILLLKPCDDLKIIFKYKLEKEISAIILDLILLFIKIEESQKAIQYVSYWCRINKNLGSNDFINTIIKAK
ncbi:hypothetical protein TCON_1991, partial [Astathelohania contejeani]